MKSGMQEELENAGYLFHLEPNEDGSIGLMGFLTPPPIILRYSPPPQMGISLEDVRIDIVRTAWRHYYQSIKYAEMKSILSRVVKYAEMNPVNDSKNTILDFIYAFKRLATEIKLYLEE